MNTRQFLTAALITLFYFNCARAAETSAKVASPDGKIVFLLNADSSGQMNYQATCDGQSVLLPSRVGVTVDGQDLGTNATLGTSLSRDVNEQTPMFGGHAVAVNHYREVTVSIVSGERKTPWTLEIRAYDDGIAFRYRVAGEGNHRVAGESTTWALPSGGTGWYQPHNRRKDYEAVFQTSAISSIRELMQPRPTTTPSTQPAQPTVPMIATPLTVKLPSGIYTALTEANLIDFSDMALECLPDNTFKAYFHNQPNGWDWQGSLVSPWRVTMIARDLNALVNNDMVRNLCPPPAPELAAADWIKPGRSTWHWMVTGRPKLADQKQWVDWTKQLGFEQYIIDDGWIMWKSADGQGDAWACMKGVVDYAATQNVKIWAWVNSKELLDTPARDAYMSKAQATGVVGLKIDFMKPADVEWVKWYDDTLRDAARHHLMLDFHGALKPSGRQRTWPNELTREAIHGREGGKQSGLHDTTLPFTRYIQGPADYTPTDFRPDKLKGSSWAHELSMAIIFTSPLLCYGGSPENYLQNEAIDVLKSIPATWDETIVLPGSEIGSLAAYARRKGDTWFVGVLNGGEDRPFKINPSFLGAGSWQVEELADASDKPDGWKHATRTIKGADAIEMTLRKDGGYVARFTQARN